MLLLTELSLLLRHKRSFFRNDCINRNYNALLFSFFFKLLSFLALCVLRTEKQLCRGKILPRLRKIFALSGRGVPDWGQRRGGRGRRRRDAKSGFKLHQHFAISSTTAGLKHGCWICFISGRHAAASPLPRPQPSGGEQERRGKRGRREVLRLENREYRAMPNDGLFPSGFRLLSREIGQLQGLQVHFSRLDLVMGRALVGLGVGAV